MAAIPNSNIRKKLSSGKWVDQVEVCQETGNSIPVEFVASDTTPQINNINLINANTEQSFNLQSGLRQLIIRVRTPVNAKIQIAFNSGESGTNYITIPAGTSLNLKDINFNSKVLYLQSDKSNTEVELLQLT